jgi:uncharacterized protein YjbK
MVEKLGIDESKIKNLGNLQVIRYVRLLTTSSICFLSSIYGDAKCVLGKLVLCGV